MRRKKNRGIPNRRKSKLGLPDLEHAKSARIGQSAVLLNLNEATGRSN